MEHSRVAHVPKVVKADGVRETGLVEQRLERVAVCIVAVHTGSRFRGEDQALELLQPW